MGLVEVDLKQGSDEWLEWRETKCCASEAPIVMGCAPSWYQVRTWNELRLVKVGMGPVDASDFVKWLWSRGLKQEAKARAYFYKGYRPVCFEGGDYSASLDAYDSKGRWVEIKSPKDERSSLLRHVRGNINAGRSMRDRIPDYVWWQMVHQSMVLGGSGLTATLLVWLDKTNHEEVTLGVKKLNMDVPILRGQWQRFMDGFSQHPGGA